jgi:hypothetical protein
MQPAYKNIGHWSPQTGVSPLLRPCLVLGGIMTFRLLCDGKTHSTFDQSRSAGQSNAPVTSWLNPRSDLMLRERGGMITCPLGTSHLRTTNFRVLVSSPCMPEAPLPSCYNVSLMTFHYSKLTNSPTWIISSSSPLIR